MQESELVQLVEKVIQRKDEHTYIELKAAKKGTPTALYDSLSSLSNTDGGIIIFGIDEPNGYAVCGVPSPKDLIADVSRQCDGMVPKVRPLFTQATIDGKEVVSAEIPALPAIQKPCYYPGLGVYKGSFVRVGDADEVMSEYEVFTLLSYRERIYPESSTFEHFSLDALDPNKVSFLLAKERQKTPKAQLQSDADLLENIGACVKGKPTLAGLLTMGKYPQALSPDLVLSCSIPATMAYGESDEMGRRFLAEAKFTGTISEIVDQGVSFVASHMDKSIVIGEDGKRHDEPDYPLPAIREAIVNSLIHRDYSMYKLNVPVSLTMYGDRLVIENPGSLYGSNTIEKLGTPGRSDIRNPFLVSLVETEEGTENMNSGIIAMRQYMAKAGKLPPLFENLPESFRVTFFKKAAKDALSSREEEIVAFCHKPRSKAALAARFGFEESRASYFYRVYILPLIEKGVLSLTLPNKPRSKNQRIVASNAKDAS